MRRNALNFTIDALFFLAMLAMAWTGVIMRFILPPGSGGRGGGMHGTLWGWSRHDWGDLHFWLAVTGVALLLVHVLLHWSWVYAMGRRALVRSDAGSGAPARRASAVWGAALLTLSLASLVGLGMLGPRFVVNTRQGGGPPRQGAMMHDGEGGPPGALARSAPAEAGAAGPHRRGAGHSGDGRPPSTQPGEDEMIRGSMTLSEVAAASGVSVETIRADLDLPASVPVDERLGRLRRQYGFEIEDVRKVVQARRGQPVGDR